MAWENEIKACNMSVIHTTSLMSCDQTDGLYFSGAESCFFASMTISGSKCQDAWLALGWNYKDQNNLGEAFFYLRLRDFKSQRPTFDFTFPCKLFIQIRIFSEHDLVQLSTKPHHPINLLKTSDEWMDLVNALNSIHPNTESFLPVKVYHICRLIKLARLWIKSLVSSRA